MTIPECRITESVAERVYRRVQIAQVVEEVPHRHRYHLEGEGVHLEGEGVNIRIFGLAWVNRRS